MSPSNPEAAYGNGARLAHWLTLLLLIGSFGLGWTMTELSVSPLRLRLYAYHKWIGVSVFLLVLLRLAWRYYAPPPVLPVAMPAWEKAAARFSHALLYVLLVLVPLSGWLMSSAKGFQTVYFGLLPIPDLLAKNPELGRTLETVHESLTWLFIALIAVHALAALKHHFIDRDDVLARMVPGLKARREI